MKGCLQGIEKERKRRMNRRVSLAAGASRLLEEAQVKVTGT